MQSGGLFKEIVVRLTNKKKEGRVRGESCIRKEEKGKGFKGQVKGGKDVRFMKGKNEKRKEN